MDINENWDINTAFTKGRNALVVIKTGTGGSLEGYKGKYARLVEYIHEKTGYAVLIADNPINTDKEENFDVTMTAAEFSADVTETDNGKDIPIYYVGFSSAASMGATYAHKYDYIKKMILVNPTFTINWHKQKRGLESFSGEKALLVIGSLDVSFKYAGLVDYIQNSKLQRITVEGADHFFSGHMDIVRDLICAGIIKE